MGSTQRRVVITGVGVICPLGSTKDAVATALHERRSGVGPLTFIPPGGLPLHAAAEAKQFCGEIDDFGPLEKDQKKAIRKGLKMMCRECQMGVAAAQWAVADARLTPQNLDPERTGVSFGTDYMLSPPDEFIEGIAKCLDPARQFEFDRWGGEGLPKMSPLWLLKYLPNMPASHVAIYNDLRGPNNSLTHREAAANIAVGEAAHIILRDAADCMVVGATGTRLHAMKSVHTLQQEEVATGDGDPTRLSRPFDRDRTGMVLGEGAGSIVLEELGHAQGRGATIFGEVLASASSCAAQGRLAARDRAMATVLAAVLRQAAVKPETIGHLHAHGLSTRSCDADEARAIGEIFGSCKAGVPVTAAKSYFGNLGAGGGMVELIASLLALGSGELFPLLNYETPDSACPLTVAHNGNCAAGSSFINLNVTPQGQASAVLIRRFE